MLNYEVFYPSKFNIPLKGNLKVAAEGSLIKIFMANDAGWFLIENILTFLAKIAEPIVRLSSRRSPLWSVFLLGISTP